MRFWNSTPSASSVFSLNGRPTNCKATGKPYAAFVACDQRGCDQKPPRGTPPPAPRVPQVHEFGDDFGNDEDF